MMDVAHDRPESQLHPPLRAIAVLLISLVAGGCYYWKPVTVEPRTAIAADHPSKVRVTIHDSTQQVLLNPVTAGDTLLGVRDAPEHDRVAIGLRDITGLEVLRQQAAPVAILLLLIIGAATGYVVLLSGWT